MAIFRGERGAYAAPAVHNPGTLTTKRPNLTMRWRLALQSPNSKLYREQLLK
jgi:hypothetical protein